MNTSKLQLLPRIVLYWSRSYHKLALAQDCPSPPAHSVLCCFTRAWNCLRGHLLESQRRPQLYQNVYLHGCPQTWPCCRPICHYSAFEGARHRSNTGFLCRNVSILFWRCIGHISGQEGGDRSCPWCSEEFPENWSQEGKDVHSSWFNPAGMHKCYESVKPDASSSTSSLFMGSGFKVWILNVARMVENILTIAFLMKGNGRGFAFSL